jgi:hypothetical protein
MQKFVKFLIKVYPNAMEKSLMKGLSHYHEINTQDCENSEPLLHIMNQIFNSI